MEPPYTKWSGLPRTLLLGEFVLEDLKAHGKCTKKKCTFHHHQNYFTSKEFCRGFPPYPSLPVRQEISNKHVAMYADLNCAIQVNADIVHNAKRWSWGQVIITCAQDRLLRFCITYKRGWETSSGLWYSMHQHLMKISPVSSHCICKGSSIPLWTAKRPTGQRRGSWPQIPPGTGISHNEDCSCPYRKKMGRKDHSCLITVRTKERTTRLFTVFVTLDVFRVICTLPISSRWCECQKWSCHWQYQHIQSRSR